MAWRALWMCGTRVLFLLPFSDYRSWDELHSSPALPQWTQNHSHYTLYWLSLSGTLTNWGSQRTRAPLRINTTHAHLSKAVCFCFNVGNCTILHVFLQLTCCEQALTEMWLCPLFTMTCSVYFIISLFGVLLANLLISNFSLYLLLLDIDWWHMQLWHSMPWILPRFAWQTIRPG